MNHICHPPGSYDVTVDTFALSDPLGELGRTCRETNGFPVPEGCAGCGINDVFRAMARNLVITTRFQLFKTGRSLCYISC